MCSVFRVVNAKANGKTNPSNFPCTVNNCINNLLNVPSVSIILLLRRISMFLTVAKIKILFRSPIPESEIGNWSPLVVWLYGCWTSKSCSDSTLVGVWWFWVLLAGHLRLLRSVKVHKSSSSWISLKTVCTTHSVGSLGRSLTLLFIAIIVSVLTASAVFPSCKCASVPSHKIVTISTPNFHHLYSEHCIHSF